MASECRQIGGNARRLMANSPGMVAGGAPSYILIPPLTL